MSIDLCGQDERRKGGKEEGKSKAGGKEGREGGRHFFPNSNILFIYIFI